MLYAGSLLLLDGNFADQPRKRGQAQELCSSRVLKSQTSTGLIMAGDHVHFLLALYNTASHMHLQPRYRDLAHRVIKRFLSSKTGSGAAGLLSAFTGG